MPMEQNDKLSMQDIALRPILQNLNALSIRSRIILFTLVATIVPAASLGWLFYVGSERVLKEKTTQEMVTGASQLQNELDIWLKAKSYDLKVFSTSFVISENLKLLTRSPAEQNKATEDIQSYFQLLLSQFSNYRQLMLFGTEGELLVSSHNVDPVTPVPKKWNMSDYKEDRVLIVELSGSPYFWVAMPVVSSARQINGWLAVEMDLTLISTLIIGSRIAENTAISLVDDQGATILHITEEGVASQKPILTLGNTLEFLENKNQLISVSSDSGKLFMGAAAFNQSMPWSVVMLRLESDIYAGINKLRNISILIALSLMILIGFISTLLAHSILHPLHRLKVAAEKVSEGDLNVSLDNVEKDELGQAMHVFNGMVEKLSTSYQKLELLSTTDALTGLSNRKRVLEILADALERYRRYGTIFSILMIDIDYFKRVNDQYGHLAGDTVLKQVGQIFSRALRNIDTAARYGGEEFLIILDQSNETEARNTAERIRKEVDRQKFKFEQLDLHCTLSIGVATVRNSNQTENILIREADDALYKAKHDGRNRSYIFSEEPVAAVDFIAKKNK